MRFGSRCYRQWNSIPLADIVPRSLFPVRTATEGNGEWWIRLQDAPWFMARAVCKFWKKTTAVFIVPRSDELQRRRAVVSTSRQSLSAEYRPYVAVNIRTRGQVYTLGGVRNTCVKCRTFVKHTPSTDPTSKETDRIRRERALTNAPRRNKNRFIKRKTVKGCDSKRYSYFC